MLGVFWLKFEILFNVKSYNSKLDAHTYGFQSFYEESKPASRKMNALGPTQ